MKKHRVNSKRFRLKAGLRTLGFWLWLIRVIGVIVPRRLRADWRKEWEAELRYRELLLAEWDKLDWRAKLDLLWHSAGARLLSGTGTYWSAGGFGTRNQVRKNCQDCGRRRRFPHKP